jgi:hypothetical protein
MLIRIYESGQAQKIKGTIAVVTLSWFLGKTILVPFLICIIPLKEYLTMFRKGVSSLRNSSTLEILAFPI